MTRSPAASAESTKPQAWRPIVSSATTGPRVKSAPLWIMFRPPNPRTTTHSQVTLRKNVQPSRRSCSVEVASARGARGGMFTGISRSAARAQVKASTASAQPGPDRDDEEGAERRAEHREAVARQGEQRVGLLERLARHQLRDQPGHRRHRHRGHRSVQGGQRDDHPELGTPGQHEHGDGALRERGGDVGDLQDHGAGETVGRSRRPRAAARSSGWCARPGPGRSRSPGRRCRARRRSARCWPSSRRGC